MIRKAVHELVENKNLDFETTEEVTGEIMSGDTTQVQMSSFLTALRMKREVIDEITACVIVMRDKAVKLSPPFLVMGIVETGGDEVGIFNIFTISVFVVTTGGIRMVKHGNRSVSNKSDAVDVLERLGVELALTAEQAETVLEDT